MFSHILMNQHLKVGSYRAICADYHVCTHAGIFGHIAIWIIDLKIGSVIGDIVVGSFDSSGNQILREACPKAVVGGEKNCNDKKFNHYLCRNNNTGFNRKYISKNRQ